MSKENNLDKKVWEEAVMQKEHGAAFPSQGFEVLAAVPKWGWSVKLMDDFESIILFASEVKAASKDYPNLVTITDRGVRLNNKALVERKKAKKACVFRLDDK